MSLSDDPLDFDPQPQLPNNTLVNQAAAPTRAYFSSIDTTTRKIHADFVAKVRQPLGFTDCKEGFVYAALSLASNRFMVKVGFTEDEGQSRVDAITVECGQKVEQSFTSGKFVGAHRVERMFHKYLRPINYSRFDCKCGKVNTEWYDAGYEWLVGLILAMEWWMKVRKPYDVDAGKRKEFLVQWKKLEKKDKKNKDKKNEDLDSKLLKLMRKDLLRRYQFRLKQVWNDALLAWEMSQYTQHPITLHEFFTRGPEVRCQTPLPATISVQKLWRRQFEKHGLDSRSFHQKYGTPLSAPQRFRPPFTHSVSAPVFSTNNEQSFGNQSDSLVSDEENSDEDQHIFGGYATHSSNFDSRPSLWFQRCLLPMIVTLEGHLAALLSVVWTGFPILQLCQIAHYTLKALLIEKLSTEISSETTEMDFHTVAGWSIFEPRTALCISEGLEVQHPDINTMPRSGATSTCALIAVVVVDEDELHSMPGRWIDDFKDPEPLNVYRDEVEGDADSYEPSIFTISEEETVEQSARDMEGLLTNGTNNQNGSSTSLSSMNEDSAGTTSDETDDVESEQEYESDDSASQFSETKNSVSFTFRCSTSGSSLFGEQSRTSSESASKDAINWGKASTFGQSLQPSPTKITTTLGSLFPPSGTSVFGKQPDEASESFLQNAMTQRNTSPFGQALQSTLSSSTTPSVGGTSDSSRISSFDKILSFGKNLKFGDVTGFGNVSAFGSPSSFDTNPAPSSSFNGANEVTSASFPFSTRPFPAFGMPMTPDSTPDARRNRDAGAKRLKNDWGFGNGMNTHIPQTPPSPTSSKKSQKPRHPSTSRSIKFGRT